MTIDELVEMAPVYDDDLTARIDAARKLQWHLPKRQV